MRILLLADIHANYAALQAIREPHDLCLCLGDLVEYGPSPAPCLDWVRRHAAVAVRGNHDHGCVQKVSIFGQTGFRYLTMATRRATYEMLGPDHRRYLADLPTTQMLTVDGRLLFLVHATPRDPLDEYTPTDPKIWATRLAGVRAEYICVGHTHQQFQLPVGRTVVVNPGSVGLPRDGDPRARYAVLDNGQLELKQVEYDIEATLHDLDAAPFPPRAKAMLAEVYRSGRCTRPEASAAMPMPVEEAA